MKKSLLLLFILITFNMSIFSQEEENEEEDEEIIELKLDDYDVFDEDLFSLEQPFKNIKQPFIKISTGISSPEYKGEKFEQLENFRMIFGFNKFVDKSFKDKGIIRKYSNYGLLIENYEYRSKLFTNESITNNEIAFWKFGFIKAEGYGYILSENADITLGQENGLGWSKLNYSNPVNKDTLGIPISNFDKFQDRFFDDVRFSSYFEAFIKIRPIKNVSIDLGYQRDLIYPRFLFWHSTVSSMTEGLAEGLASYFTKKIMKSSPYAGPVVYFILKNGISYAFMELRKDNMNWPIKSEQPLIINSFNFGMNFHF